MDRISRNKWQISVVAVIIFVLGFASGIFALNLYRGWGHRTGGPREDRDRFEQLATSLQLQAEQRAKVQQILGETREQLRALRKASEPRVNEIRQQTDQRLQEVLTPEQWQRFQKERDEMRGRRGRGGRGDRR